MNCTCNPVNNNTDDSPVYADYVYPKERLNDSCACCIDGMGVLCAHGDWCVDEADMYSWIGYVESCHFDEKMLTKRGCKCPDDSDSVECECCKDEDLHKPCSNTTTMETTRGCVLKNETCPGKYLSPVAF